MKIIVPIQLIPDLVEELEIDESGKALDLDYLSWIINEFDDHAVEQAVILKEKYGADVTVIAPDFDEVDDALFASSAKGADRLVKISADYDNGFNNHGLAKIFSPLIKTLGADLILTGVSNCNATDGPLGPLLAEMNGLPYIGYVSGVSVENGKALVHKEYPGGLLAEMEISLPAVLGIQAADAPPRYVPISKIRQAMKSAEIEEEDGELDNSGTAVIQGLSKPEAAERATILKGDIDDIAEKLVEIFKEQSLL